MQRPRDLFRARRIRSAIDQIDNGLPSTFVHDLIIHPRDDVMVIATHGRGMYAMDVRPLRGEIEEVDTTEASAEAKPDTSGSEERDR